ncbi:MAG TPA: hypothetical protein VEB43_06725 [Anaeromyxobacter sp.]|nr:hypothetical protein [Anaeromyxobacter sp.]
MTDVSSQIAVAQVQLVQRQDRLEGQQALQLIDGAAGAAQSLSSSPPVQPVQVTPRAGSTVEVVA